MYKILINIITKTGNVWTFYQKDGADYVGKDLNDIKEVALELLDKYGRSNIKIINQRCGDDTENVIEYLYSEEMGVRNYEELENLPWINDVELIGKLSLDDLGIDQDFVKDNDYVHTDNNYSTEEKEKLSGLENYDDTEIRDLINGKQPTGDYALRSDIPDVSNFITKTVADLVNYYNKNETYTQAEIKALIEAVKTIDMEIVPVKPDEPKSNIIYLIPNGKAGNNIYDEYVYVNNKWELIGSTDIDLSNYYNKAEIDSKINIELSEEEKYTDMQTFANKLIGDFAADLSEKQNIIPDLEDIRDGALKGSTALQSVPAEYITETELNNYHDDTKQDELIAGENITIENNVISATNSGAVDSVNGQIGEVILNAQDVGALPNTTKIPTKTSDIENDSGYVKNTDYADNSNFGVVKTNSNYGIQTENGVLYVRRATEGEIKTRHQWAPITPNNLDLALKIAMCDGVGAKWTEDEKLKAQERIGVSKIPSGMTLAADVVLEESVESVNFNEIIVKNYEKLIIYVFRPATTFSSGYGSISFSSNVGGGLGGTDYNAFSTNQKINVRHTLVKTDGIKFEATSEWVNAGNNINDTAFIKSAYKPEVNPYSGYLKVDTSQTFPVGTHILIYTK